MRAEVAIHADFYDFAQEVREGGIGVPVPYYATELGHDKLMAMEKLPAHSVDDVLRGVAGVVPEWLDIDLFCEKIHTFLDQAHERGMYHRDMHPGNIMIRQSLEEPEDGIWGYIIDFGLSGYGNENLDPYKKEVAGTVFTYNNDHAIIPSVRKVLHQRRKIHQQE